jgi:hypothetical protein
MPRRCPALVVLVGGCAAAGVASPSAAAAAVAVTAEGSLAPGRYTYPGFAPRIELEVGDGWQVAHLMPEFVDVARQDEGGFSAIMFQRPARIFGPPGGAPATTPDEAVELLRQNDGLEVSDPVAAEVGGLAGLEVDLIATAQDTQVFAGAQPLLGIGPDNDVRLAFFAVDGGVLSIGLVSPPGAMDAWSLIAQPVLDSIRIGD